VYTIHKETTGVSRRCRGMRYQNRITIDPEIMHGKPVIKNTRIPVYIVLNLLAGGLRPEEILKEYPDLAREDILACLEYAAELAQEEVGILEAEGIR
jgi:uncharacterized protein (DUF433 family)